MTTKLNDLIGSRWTGKSELWEDPLGDVAQRSDCTIAIDESTVTYSWSRKGKDHTGTLKLTAGGADFSDTFHQKTKTSCTSVSDSWALLSVFTTYMEEWGWRINLCLRTPTDELVLQMTNIAPWGEEARAVRMVCKRDDS